MIPLEHLQQVQDQFTMAMGLAAILVDYRGKPVTSASGFTDFCSTMRESAEGRAGCYSCDAHGGLQAAIRGDSHMYLCHTGLVDFSIPLMAGDEYLGAMLCGQIRMEPDETHSLPTVAVYGPANLSPELRLLRDRVPTMPMSRIRAACDTLGALMRGMLATALGTQPEGEPVSPPTPIRASLEPIPHPTSPKSAAQPARRLDVVALRRALNDEDLPRAAALVRQQLDGLFAPDDLPAHRRIARAELHQTADDMWQLARELDADAAAELGHRINQDRARSATHASRFEAEEQMLGLLFCLQANLELAQNRRGHTVNDLVNRIERNPTGFLTLQAAAEFTNLSPHHLSRLFKAHTHATFIDYVMTKRIQRAKYLLKYTDQPVLRIASELRFRPANYFSRAFKAATGLTPSEFRRDITSPPADSIEDTA
ncbi:PocR ligand-binding domain-containing protein [Propionibacteriaceae bacterium Y1923]|uniref:PocR ligand-binding domain-containing protein n=1 Tax=Aestuariimicrobium sp. Y1814 TaxID=3418742 RepID=UPI003C24FB97